MLDSFTYIGYGSFNILPHATGTFSKFLQPKNDTEMEVLAMQALLNHPIATLIEK